MRWQEQAARSVRVPRKKRQEGLACWDYAIGEVLQKKRKGLTSRTVYNAPGHNVKSCASLAYNTPRKLSSDSQSQGTSTHCDAGPGPRFQSVLVLKLFRHCLR